ncbi:mechanosensitive ion channel family protein [Sulfitobacter sp. SK011]|uniref:mechanosensitive ion channel family protein n=1 Tax=Sulfitobacter sp. SK011 TaxID=1389004 RepID=UPI000E0AE803|nr:mechanosensitive ion channel domain-containing protein [Sulfitobacter sp. SK011]AXI42594.1 hypothetical protein C1J02_12050 [Sulfitobacter sp. SK011]
MSFVQENLEVSYIALVLGALVVAPFLQRLIGTLLLRFAIRTETVVDDLIVDALRPFRFIYALPAFLGFYLSEWVASYTYEARLVFGLALIVLAVEFAIKILGAISAVVRHKAGVRGVSSTGYIDLLKILTVLVGLAVAASITLDSELSKIVAGLGAATAVAGFIFRDTIHSLFVGIKIASFDLIREGDWLSVPSFDADGSVEHIGLYDIKIRNWDQTTSLIPTHKVLEVANRNYSSMQNEARARQLVAKVLFDIDSVRLCDQALLEKLKKASLMPDIVGPKLEALSEQGDAPKDQVIASDAATNYDLFRIYVDRYLRQRSDLHQKRYYILVRTLEPEIHGLPMQIFAYARETGMIEFSNIQSSILSHLIVVAREFDLKFFQHTTNVHR